MALPPDTIIRKYEPRDREVVRWLCCQTGFLGKPIEPYFQDLDLFADYLTTYYTDVEPESCFVLVHKGVVKGYLLGSRRPFLHQVYSLFQNIRLFAVGMIRYRGYNQPTRDFIRWILKNSWKEVPAAPRRTAHFHINLLTEVKCLSSSAGMMNLYLDYLREHGEKKVFGQMVTFETRRGAKMLEHFGFYVLERREITKWRDKYPQPVYLTTAVKNLS